MMRVGQGVDVHAFADEEGRPLRLGGVTIPDGPGLAGHSDADVVLHAVVDALLGAAGLGDLGELVGTDQPDTAGADSAGFVALALQRLTAAGLQVGNVDVTVLAQRPRLAPHREAMRVRIAELLDLAPDAVSVKATTTDGLGFVGRVEGIACTAIALLVPRA
jgi:2-C-methyl-D-erythritol 2,4-cyclodiphosphate synthase